MRIRLAIAAALLAAPLPAATVALTDGVIHPVSSPAYRGTLLIEDGTIIAAARRVDVPRGTRRVNLDGRHVYPAFVHPATVLGLTEIGSVAGTVDTTELGDINPQLRAERSFNADSLLLAPAMSGGVVAAHVVPHGGLLSGTSAVMRLDGWTWEDMTVKAPVGMHLHFPAVHPPSDADLPTRLAFEKERRRLLDLLDTTMGAARAYGRARRAAEAGTAPAVDLDPRLEALRPVVDGELRLFIHAFEFVQIRQALDWTAEQELTDFVLVTGSDARRHAERLAADGIPVLLNGVLQLPTRDWEPYDAVYTAAAELAAAGVRFAIGDGGTRFGAANARNLPFHAAMAAAFGLAPEAALRSVTLDAAWIAGVDDRLGSLDVGKEATFVVTDGDPLEIRTRIEQVWAAGREIDLSADHQRRLYERYRQRPIE